MSVTLPPSPAPREREPKSMQQPSEDNDPTHEEIVDWEGPTDQENPENWSPLRKWTIITLVSLITFVTALASSIIAPGVGNELREFHSSNASLGAFSVSVYIIGFCVGPLFLSPLSEIYGRSPILHGSNICFLIFSVLCAVSRSLPMLIVFRLLLGIAGCPPLTLGGGTIADLLPPDKRGTALSAWTIGPLLGPVIGPVIGGFLAEAAGWQWNFWLLAILSAGTTLTSFAVLRETYAPRILEMKTKRLRRATGMPSLRDKYQTSETNTQRFINAIIRPSKMLIGSPIVLVLALYMATVYSYLYLMLTTFTTLFETVYGFNVGESGLAYLGLGVGFIIAQVSLAWFSDRHLAKKRGKLGKVSPEDRLPPLALGAILLPVGLFWYGWSAQEHVHWMVPIVGTGLIGIGILYAFLPIQLYLVDAFGRYAVSALAANAVVRSLFGAVVPLAGKSLYSSLGYGWGNSLLGFIALAFVPAPFLLMRYGSSLRESSRFPIEL